MFIDVEKELKRLIVDCGENINVEQINCDTHLLKDLNFNSIDVIQLIVEIECKFHIKFADDDLINDKFSTFNSLLNILILKIQVKMQNE